jgi:hypothetical protein
MYMFTAKPAPIAGYRAGIVGISCALFGVMENTIFVVTGSQRQPVRAFVSKEKAEEHVKAIMDLYPLEKGNWSVKGIPFETETRCLNQNSQET